MVKRTEKEIVEDIKKTVKELGGGQKEYWEIMGILERFSKGARASTSQRGNRGVVRVKSYTRRATRKRRR